MEQSPSPPSFPPLPKGPAKPQRKAPTPRHLAARHIKETLEAARNLDLVQFQALYGEARTAAELEQYRVQVDKYTKSLQARVTKLVNKLQRPTTECPDNHDDTTTG